VKVNQFFAALLYLNNSILCLIVVPATREPPDPLEQSVTLAHLPRSRLRERQRRADGVEQPKYATEPARITERAVHHHSNRDLRHLPFRIKRHRQRLRRAFHPRPRRFESSRELSRVRPRRSVREPNPIRLVRVDSEMVIITLHVRESLREIESPDRFHERLRRKRSDHGADELKIFRQITRDVREAILEHRLASHDEIIRFDGERVRGAVEHGFFVAHVVYRRRVGEIDVRGRDGARDA